MPKFPAGKELLLINMVDTREIEYTIVLNTKEKSDLYKHFNLRKRKTDGRIDADVAACKVQFSCQTCGRQLKQVSAYEMPPFQALFFSFWGAGRGVCAFVV